MGDNTFVLAGDGWGKRSSLVRGCVIALSWKDRMNGSDFMLASDRWSQIKPCGEFPHADTRKRVEEEYLAQRRRGAEEKCWGRVQ